MIIKGKRGDLEEKAAWIISEAIGSLLEQQASLVLGIVGGSSVSGIFSALSEKEIEWSRVHLFMIDERVVPIDHPDSNYGLARPYFESLLPPGNLHPFVDKLDTPEQSAAFYYEQLGEYGGHFDIVLLSSGEDGHVAALFPDHPSIRNTGQGFIAMSNAPKPPPDRISAGLDLLKRSEVGILLFLGEKKSRAMEFFQNDRISLEQCPAKLVCMIPQHYILTNLEVRR
jgi:6-phosphogluconolactonase